jgi:hypothetical protein
MNAKKKGTKQINAPKDRGAAWAKEIMAEVAVEGEEEVAEAEEQVEEAASKANATTAAKKATK